MLGFASHIQRLMIHRGASLVWSTLPKVVWSRSLFGPHFLRSCETRDLQTGAIPSIYRHSQDFTWLDAVITLKRTRRVPHRVAWRQYRLLAECWAKQSVLTPERDGSRTKDDDEEDWQEEQNHRDGQFRRQGGCLLFSFRHTDVTVFLGHDT